MKLSTGKIAFPIEFDNGNVEKIYFNPNDPELAVRFKEFGNNVLKKIEHIEKIEITANGTAKDADFVDLVSKFQKMICEEVDIAFGCDVSNVVFKYCSPLAIVGGDYFINNFVNAITPEIEKEIKKANKDIQDKMNKHLDKYI